MGCVRKDREEFGMANLTPAELNEKFKDMSIEEALKVLQPLLVKHARWDVPGYDFDDIFCELQVVLWRCHKSYDSKKGSVINLLTTAFKRRIMNLHKLANTQLPIIRFVCPVGECGVAVPPTGQFKAPYCPRGCTRPDGRKIVMLPEKSEYHMVSIDAEDLSGNSWEITAPQTLGSPDPEADEEWRHGLTSDEIKLVERGLDGKELSTLQKSKLLLLLPRVTGKFSSSVIEL